MHFPFLNIISGKITQSLPILLLICKFFEINISAFISVARSIKADTAAYKSACHFGREIGDFGFAEIFVSRISLGVKAFDFDGEFNGSLFYDV